MRPGADWDPDLARSIIAEHVAKPGAALPILHALQAEFGFIPEPAVRLVAEALNLSRADVHGVVSFYHDFRAEPAGRHVLQICRAEACQAMGGAALARDLLDRLGIAWGETTPDGRLTVEPIYCLGLCACSPAALLDGEPAGRLKPGMLEALAEGARA
jgi:formate dehydrogenase subunit gamma